MSLAYLLVLYSLHVTNETNQALTEINNHRANHIHPGLKKNQEEVNEVSLMKVLIYYSLYKRTNLWKPSCKLRDGTLRNLSPVIRVIFTESCVVWWICPLLAPHNAPAGANCTNETCLQK